jgi:5-methylcytosine-specific restriction endonuclease McrA
MKTCPQCQITKPETEFYNWNCINQWVNWCRQCYRTFRSEQLKNPATGNRIRARANARRAANPEHRKEIEQRAAAKRKRSPSRKKYLCQQSEYKHQKLRQKYQASNPVKTCIICDIRYCNLFGKHSFKTTCSPECSKKRDQRMRCVKELNRKAKRKATSYNGPINPYDIFERDKWRCQICLRKTPKNKRGTYQPNAPELDHIIPLAKDGSHTWNNVQCACRKCNRKKSDQTTDLPLPFQTGCRSSIGQPSTPIAVE